MTPHNNFYDDVLTPHSNSYDDVLGITPYDMGLSSSAHNPRYMLRELSRIYINVYHYTVYVVYENDVWDAWTRTDWKHMSLNDSNAVLCESAKPHDFEYTSERGRLSITVGSDTYRLWSEITHKYL